MKISTDKFEEIVDSARDLLQGMRVDSEVLARDLAEMILELAGSCVIGVPCARHYGAVHGQEAEELRAGIEQLIRNTADVDDDRSTSEASALFLLRSLRKSLIFLLDHIEARDSLAFLEAAAPKESSPTCG